MPLALFLLSYNPAITIAMLVAGKINLKDAVGHIVAQFAGATAGAGILYLIVSGQNGFTGLGEWALGSNGWGEGYLGNYSTSAALLQSSDDLSFSAGYFCHYLQNGQ